jgi:hypothetical protein
VNSIGLRYPQAPRFFCSSRVAGRHFSPSQSDASQGLWQKKSYQVDTLKSRGFKRRDEHTTSKRSTNHLFWLWWTSFKERFASYGHLTWDKIDVAFTTDCPMNTGPLSERPLPGTGANRTTGVPRKWGNEARREHPRSWRDRSPEHRSSRGDPRDDRQGRPPQGDRPRGHYHRGDDRPRHSETDRKRDYDPRRYSDSRSRSPRQRRSRSPRHNRRDSDYPERKRRRVET